jgi:hypothetical protein
LSKQKNPFWSFFASVYLTITLLVGTVILAIVGTFIPQQDGAREFSQGIPPGLASFSADHAGLRCVSFGLVFSPPASPFPEPHRNVL